MQTVDLRLLEDVQVFDAKKPDLKNGTYDAITREKLEFKDGYDVTFLQNLSKEDPYGGCTKETYAAMCAITKNVR